MISPGVLSLPRHTVMEIVRTEQRQGWTVITCEGKSSVPCDQRPVDMIWPHCARKRGWKAWPAVCLYLPLSGLLVSLRASSQRSEVSGLSLWFTCQAFPGTIRAPPGRSVLTRQTWKKKANDKDIYACVIDVFKGDVHTRGYFQVLKLGLQRTVLSIRL